MNLAIHTRRMLPPVVRNGRAVSTRKYISILAWYIGGDGRERSHVIHLDESKSEFENHTLAAKELAEQLGFVARDWYHASYVHHNHASGWVYMGLATAAPMSDAPTGWKLAAAFTTHTEKKL